MLGVAERRWRRVDRRAERAKTPMVGTTYVYEGDVELYLKNEREIITK